MTTVLLSNFFLKNKNNALLLSLSLRLLCLLLCLPPELQPPIDCYVNTFNPEDPLDMTTVATIPIHCNACTKRQEPESTVSPLKTM